MIRNVQTKTYSSKKTLEHACLAPTDSEVAELHLRLGPGQRRRPLAQLVDRLGQSVHLAVLHGQMKPADKDDVMRRFGRERMSPIMS